MIDFLIKSTVSLIVFIVFYYFFLENEKMNQFKRFYLLITIVISFIIPFINIEVIEIIPVVNKIEPETLEKTSEPIEKIIFNQDKFQIPKKQNIFPYLYWFIYVLGLLIMAFRFGKNCLKLIVKAKSNPNLKFKKAKLILVDEKTLPYTFLNAIYINNKDYSNNKIEEELFNHELVHVSQNHTIDILFIEFLITLFWFNPILILYKKAIQLNHEFLADDFIVNEYNDIPFYQNLLLNKGMKLSGNYLASNLNYLVTKKRLIMMTKITSRRMSIIKSIAFLPVFASLFYFFSVNIIAQEKVITIKSKSNINSKSIENENKLIATEINENPIDEIKESYIKPIINTKKIIAIDAGHGGKDLGKKVNDVFESEIVETIAKKIKSLNTNSTIEIVLLREDDSFISLNDRVNKINEINPDMLISLHINTSSHVDQNGVSAYVCSGNEFYEKSIIMANKLIENISKYELNKGETKDTNLYVLKKSKCPAVTLEIGYLTNNNDREYLTSENGVNEIANGILNFLNQ